MFSALIFNLLRVQFWLGFCGVPLLWLLNWLNFRKQAAVNPVDGNEFNTRCERNSILLPRVFGSP